MSDQEQTNIINTDQKLASSGSNKEVAITREEVKQMIDDKLEELLQKTKNEIERQVQIDRASLITVFGIFASITSFLIIEFQCLKTVVTIWGVVGFSCVLFALLLGFNIGLDYLIKSRFDKDIPTPHEGYLRLIVIVFFIGCVAISCGNEWKEIIHFR